MKRIWLISIIFITPHLSFGQLSNNPSKGFTPPNASSKIDYGKIKGEIVDKDSRQPVPFATISLVDSKTEKTIGGTIADDNGEFVIKDLKSGYYNLLISFIGYAEKSIDSVEISNKNVTQNLGTIALQEKATELEEVVVTGEKELIEERVDRLIYNAEKDITTSGGDATDVLRRVPLLSVDLDGNVSLRGSQNIKVLIDNKPSTISAGSISDALKQIPADQIKSVEVITSPSARYDAEGTGGIINIITKKNNFEGSSLNINSGVGIRGTNLGLNGNYRKGRNSFSLGGFGRAGYNINGEFSNEQTVVDPETMEETFTTQQAKTDNNMLFGRYNFGWDFEFNKYNWLSTSVNYGVFNFSGNQNNLLTHSFQGDSLVNSSIQDVNFVNHSNTVDVSLNFIKTYETKGKEFSILSLYSQNNRRNDFENLSVEPTTQRFKNDNRSTNKELTFQVDYVSPIDDNKIFEIGGKNIMRLVNSDYTYYQSNGPDDPYVALPDDELTNIFDYTQNITAGYISYTHKFEKDYSLMAGGRYEYTNIGANFLSEEDLSIPSYGAFVPSINASKKLKKGNMIKIAYNRRIQRPSLAYLNPNIDATNPRNISQGNPNLEPEYTDNFEISFSDYKMGKSINISAFVRNTNGSIQPVRSVFSDGVVYTTYENIGEEDAYGLSVFGNIVKGKKFMINASVDAYYAVLDNNVDDPLYHSSNEGFVVSGRLFGSYSLTDNWSLQGFGFARGRRVQLQGSQSGFYMYSLNINRKFADDRGTIGIGAENFLTPEFDMVSETSTPLINQQNINTMRNMNFKINFSYRIGKMDFNPMGKKKGKSIENDDLKERQNYNQQMMSQ